MNQQKNLEISSYHAHVYFITSAERQIAGIVRKEIFKRFEVKIGRWRDKPVGPHPIPMYQIAFDANLFSDILFWLMFNRKGLTILIHPNTDNSALDHLDYAIWMGQILELNMSAFQN